MCEYRPCRVRSEIGNVYISINSVPTILSYSANYYSKNYFITRITIEGTKKGTIVLTLVLHVLLIKNGHFLNPYFYQYGNITHGVSVPL